MFMGLFWGLSFTAKGVSLGPFFHCLVFYLIYGNGIVLQFFVSPFSQRLEYSVPCREVFRTVTTIEEEVEREEEDVREMVEDKEKMKI